MDAVSVYYKLQTNFVFLLSYHSSHLSFSCQKYFAVRQFEDNIPIWRSVIPFAIPW